MQARFWSVKKKRRKTVIKLTVLICFLKGNGTKDANRPHKALFFSFLVIEPVMMMCSQFSSPLGEEILAALCDNNQHVCIIVRFGDTDSDPF